MIPDHIVKNLESSLRGIIEIGKRNTENPKYDGFYTAAREALAEYEAAIKEPVRVRLPNLIPSIDCPKKWAHSFSQLGHKLYFERKRDEVIKALREQGIEVEP